MKPSLPALAVTVATALLAGALLAAAADKAAGEKDEGGAKIVVRTAGDDAEGARPKPNADREKGERDGRGPGLAPDGTRPVDRLLEYVRKNHPDEYERLITLRRENPEAFQQSLRRRFEEASTRFREPGGDPRRTNAWRRSEGGETVRPPASEGMEGRRPAVQPDRPEGEKRWNAAGEKTERAAPKSAGKHGPAEPVVAESMERVKEMTDEYHRARGEPKEQVRRRIREQIAQTYELRERDRAARIRKMEEELVRLKGEIEERRGHRDQIIDRKVAEVLGEDPTAW